MVTPAILALHGEPLDPLNPATATYHNLYAIIVVVMAFVAMESAMNVVDREKITFSFN
jgi:hypothetical protein